MSDNLIGDIAELQELEKIQYAQEIKENASDYSAYVNTRVNQIVDESYNRKRSSFQKALVDMGRYMDMEHNAANFKTRSADVKRIQDVIEINNNTMKNASIQDIDNSKRQFEINEYYYYNKLETLFFLQLFFIATLSMAIIFHLQKTGIVNTTMAGYMTLILMGIVIVTGVYRYFYTKRTRDTRLWHRRKFEERETRTVESPLKCDANGNVVVDVDKIPGGTAAVQAGRCAKKLYGSAKEKAEDKFNEVNAAIISNMKQFQQYGTLPDSEGGQGLFDKCTF